MSCRVLIESSTFRQHNELTDGELQQVQSRLANFLIIHLSCNMSLVSNRNASTITDITM